MNVYEIRVLDQCRHTLAIVQVAHVSDFSAVRSARKLAGRRGLEVWRDLECIYSEPKDEIEHHRRVA